jgi:hypothetical protein
MAPATRRPAIRSCSGPSLDAPTGNDFRGGEVTLFRQKVGNAELIDLHPLVAVELKQVRERRGKRTTVKDSDRVVQAGREERITRRSGPSRGHRRRTRHFGNVSSVFPVFPDSTSARPFSASTIDALIRSGAPAADVVPTLLTRIDAPDRRTSISAVDALGRFGPAAADAAPKIRARKTGGDAYENVVTAHSLFRITGEVDDAAVLRVAAALSSEFVPVHHRAAEALREFGPKAKPALPQIANAMRRLTRGTRTVLCDAMAGIGSKDGVPALRGVLRGELDDDRNAICHTDDVVGYEDVAAAIRALVALHAAEALPDIRKVETWEERPESDEMRRLRRLANEAVTALGG